MQHRRLARIAVAVVAATVITAAGNGHAAPKRKLGPVRGLAVEITKPTSYRVAATWDGLAAATSYKVTLASAGAVLSTDRVIDNRWVLTRALTVGSTVTIKVVPMAGNQPGRAATVSSVVPDLTPPTGTYTVDVTDTTATITQTGLSDDLTAVDAISREIDWDNGSGWQPWPTGDQASYAYPTGKAAYHPRVRLTDTAGNRAVLALAPVVIDDTDAPTGAFSVAPAQGWAGYTRTTVTQIGEVSDDVSAPGDIGRVVAWADGTTTVWAAGTTLKHVYQIPGTYTPVVTLTDEAGRSTQIATAPVTMNADTLAPRANLTRPNRARSARAWKPLRGKASDVAGSGVRHVSVRVVEKRDGRWYAYRATARTWVKASSKAAALQRSRANTVVPVDGSWRSPVTGLRKGTLIVKVHGRDNVGNVSPVRTYRQQLTRR